MAHNIAGGIFPIRNEIISGKINQFFAWLQILPNYKNIYIVANSPCALTQLLHTHTGSQDLMIVFNRFDHVCMQQHAGDVVVIHRQFSDKPFFHQHPAPLLREEKCVRYFALSDYYRYININDVDFLQPYNAIFCADFIPYSENKEKVPSSGYTLLYLLNHYLQSDPKCPPVHLIGFQFSGLPMHDWEYEKQQSESFVFFASG